MSLKPKHVDFQSIWDKLTVTMNHVITSMPIEKATWYDRFIDVYSLCTAAPEPLTDELYKSIKSFLESHVHGLREKVRQSETDLLTVYHRYWLEYSSGADLFDSLFRYLNHQYIRRHKQTEADIHYGYTSDLTDSLLEIGELALDTWRAILIEDLGAELVDLVLQEIDKDRNGGLVNKTMLKGVINSFVVVKQYKRKNSLLLYEQYFEEKYLKRSSEYYNSQANEYLKSHNCPQYMKKVLQLLIEEEIRSSNFLHSSSFPKVSKTCKERMISDHLPFLHSECREMIRENRIQDLQHMYTLLKSVLDGLPHVANELQTHIEQTGFRLIKSLKEENHAASFVECIIEVHNKFSSIIKECFLSDKLFERALTKACETIVNHREGRQPCKSPELVSKYCDSLLRKGIKGLTESEVDDKLQASITVFKYIEDKDLFQKFYSRNLAKRLIHGLCISMDMEEAMINRLKATCGYDFTSKLHRMYTDIRLSTDLNNKFVHFLEGQSVNVNFNVNVLQAGAWPLNSTQSPFLIPQQLTKSVLMFEKFYNQKFNGRKLSWLHHLSQAEVRVQLTSKTYFVTMSTYQLAVLLLFNDDDALTSSYISTSTNLSERELEKTISLLVDAKLLSKPNDKQVESGYVINKKFANKRTRFKIAAATPKDVVQEIQATHTSVSEDRKLYMQAAIVRIMKARKVLRHIELVQEVIMQSRARFSPSISMIKKSIESLIDKSYIERTANTPDEYSYLA